MSEKKLSDKTKLVISETNDGGYCLSVIRTDGVGGTLGFADTKKEIEDMQRNYIIIYEYAKWDVEEDVTDD